MRTIPAMVLLAFLIGGVREAAADVIFDTTPSWNGSDVIGSWGSVQSGATATYGQTFLAPAAASVLQSFTFYISGQGNDASVTFQAAVYAWSGALQGNHYPQGSTGSPLFTSPNMTFTDNGSFQAVTINTGGVALTPGNAYVALFTTSDPASIAANGSSLRSFGWGRIPSHVSNDGGGGFNYFNNSTSSQLSSSPWDDLADFGDLAWKAQFTPQSVSPVPEPASITIFGLTLAGAAGYFGWPRRKKSMAL